MSTQRITPVPAVIPPSPADTKSALRIVLAKAVKSPKAKSVAAKKVKAKPSQKVSPTKKLRPAVRVSSKSSRTDKKASVRRTVIKPGVLTAKDKPAQKLIALDPEAAQPASIEVPQIQSLPCESSDCPAPVTPELAVAEPEISVEAIPGPYEPVELQNAQFEIDVPIANQELAEEGSSAPVGKEGTTKGPTVAISVLLRVLTQAWNWLQDKFKTHQGKKRLRVCETVSLGEKRFVAVIQVDGEQFLVGGASNSVSTLAHLQRPQEFADIFKSHCNQDLSQA